MILRFVTWIAKQILRTVIRIAGFLTAMALGPGLVLLMFLYEPHRPLPAIIDDLPSDPIEASHVMQGRAENVFLEGASVADMTSYLGDRGFAVDTAENHAVYHRRQLNCVESYAVVWTELGDRIRKVATLFETRCENFL